MRAIHNYTHGQTFAGKMFPICQRYDMRAIHNALLTVLQSEVDVSNMSKIRYESNSQPGVYIESVAVRCFQYVKDTI